MGDNHLKSQRGISLDGDYQRITTNHGRVN